MRKKCQSSSGESERQSGLLQLQHLYKIQVLSSKVNTSLGLSMSFIYRVNLCSRILIIGPIFALKINLELTSAQKKLRILSKYINYLSLYFTSLLPSLGCFQIDKETYLVLIDYHSPFIEIVAVTSILSSSAKISFTTSQRRRQDRVTSGFPHRQWTSSLKCTRFETQYNSPHLSE